jgi:hypothetical protein
MFERASEHEDAALHITASVCRTPGMPSPLWPLRMTNSFRMPIGSPGHGAVNDC